MGLDPAVRAGQRRVGDDGRWGDRRHIDDEVGLLAGIAEVDPTLLSASHLAGLVADASLGQDLPERSGHLGTTGRHRCRLSAANRDLEPVADTA